MQKKKRKKRLRVGRLFLLLIIILAISFACVKFIDVPIRSIIITGNENLSDQEVIEISGLKDYPSYFSTFSFNVKNKLEDNFYIETAKVRKGILSIKIDIKEEKVLYIDKSTGKKYTKDGSLEDDKIVCAPFVTNEVTKNNQEDLIKAMGKLNKGILCQTSEIKYDPNEIDDDRYYVFMNDGNSVYLTVNKFKKLNKYNTILENIGKQNGTLYLDYGDYFEVK